MAIRRYTLATDNHPASGYATIDNIEGSGEFFLEIGWRPQAATVSLATQYALEDTFVPIADATFHFLWQKSVTPPDDQIYYILEGVFPLTPITPWDAAALKDLHHTIFYADITPSLSYEIANNLWYYYSDAGSPVDSIFITAKVFTGETALGMLGHTTAKINGRLSYFGSGTDVSVSFGLPALTKFEIMTGVADDADFAEVIIINGQQVVGDTYSYYYPYGQGFYDMTIESGSLYITFKNALDVSDEYFFFIFRPVPRPELRVRFETDPFDDNGLWIVYNNLPEGMLKFNYYIR
jgi:hypothetical protein